MLQHTQDSRRVYRCCRHYPRSRLTSQGEVVGAATTTSVQCSYHYRLNPRVCQPKKTKRSEVFRQLEIGEEPKGQFSYFTLKKITSRNNLFKPYTPIPFETLTPNRPIHPTQPIRPFIQFKSYKVSKPTKIAATAKPPGTSPAAAPDVPVELAELEPPVDEPEPGPEVLVEFPP